MKSTVASVVLAVAAIAVSGLTLGAQQPVFRLMTFEVAGALRLGATQGNGEADIVDIHNAIMALAAVGAPEVQNLGYIPADMRDLIEVGDRAVAGVKTVYRTALARKAAGTLVDPGGERRVFHPPTSVRVRPPVPNPRAMFGLAGNFRQPDAPEPDRSRSLDFTKPAELVQGGLGRVADRSMPSPFLKSIASLVGQDDNIVLTPLVKDGYPNTHEAELGVVIGRRAKDVSEADAMNYVFGYTVHNDVSGRTLRTGASGTEGSAMTKGMDTFGPTGPYITLKEDVPDPNNLAIETKLNGKVFPMPNAHTKYMNFRVPAAIAMISHIMTLQPGDIIAMGVPAPTAPIVAGDTVEITIERLGTLRNRIVRIGT
jgi:2-keto-4-pentenoate hydratase/2-oxohepta-3-ene-1,7-dioic acid hydratase in catechol pathway